MMNADKLVHNIATVIVNPLIAMLFGLALIFFLWGVFNYLFHGDSEEARRQGAQHILWGVVGMMIMVSAFGILNLVLGTFGISNAVSKEIIP